MTSSKILEAFRRPEVEFDATNPEHIEAFRMLCLGDLKKTGILCAQHPNLRFRVEYPFQDVRTMMFHKVGAAYVQKVA